VAGLVEAGRSVARREIRPVLRIGRGGAVPATPCTSAGRTDRPPFGWERGRG
jgi:hypothetical protein